MECWLVIAAPLCSRSSGVMGSVIGPRHDEQLRADLEPSPLGRFVVDAEAQLAVFEEELRHAAGRGEPFDVADREHRRIPQLADDVGRLANRHSGDVENPAPALGAAAATGEMAMGRSMSWRPATARASASLTAASPSTQMTNESVAGRSAGQVVNRAKL